MKGKIRRLIVSSCFQSIFIIFLFVLGLSFTLYPLGAQVYHFYLSHQKIKTYENELKEMTPELISKRIALAQAYNDSLVGYQENSLQDPFTDLQKAGRAEYARMLKVKEMIGHISIPSINIDLPIYAGTSDSVLQKGVGHLEGSSLPVGGEHTRAVLTAHRGLPKARLFTDLDKLKKGDVFYVTNMKETLAYQVSHLQVIEPTQISALTIKENKDFVTLLTCTPYMVNSHRLLVTGERIPYSKTKATSSMSKAKENLITKTIILTFFIFSFLLLAIRYLKRKLGRNPSVRT
ncbi:class C sortase [Streptococcus sp.]|nr:class C sortase [Streptococcus sp.]